MKSKIIFGCIFLVCIFLGESFGESFLEKRSDIMVEAIKKAKRSIVLIKRRVVDFGPHQLEMESLSSGVLLSKEGHIITNYHNIKKRNKNNITVLWNEKKYKTVILKEDQYNDLALLKINSADSGDFSPAKMPKGQIKTGETVFAVGSTVFEFIDLKTEKIKNYYLLNAQKGIVVKSSDYVFSDVKANPGYSGGGLFDLTGNLVGIITKKNKETNIAISIPSEKIFDFLRETEVYNIVSKNSGALKSESLEMVNIAKQLLQISVAVKAEPKQKDYERKMSHISEIMKMYLIRPQKMDYWKQASGVIISEDGYILTAYYNVVDYCDDIFVTVFEADGRSVKYSAEIVYYDDDFKVNLALLKIQPNNPLPFVDITKTNSVIPEVGSIVFSVGNQLRFEQSFTSGVVSNITGGLIQTDAIINDGNLGGPLADYKGNLAGIVIKRESGLSGISLAVPIKNIWSFLEKAKEANK